jgi:hypothetical protein
MYLLSESHPTTTITTSQPVEVEPAPLFGISPDVQSVLKNGSYAIILFIFILFWMTRKNLSEFAKAHLEMMSRMNKSNEAHMEAQEKSLAAQEQLVKSVSRVSRNNTVLTVILAKQYNLDLDNINKED